MLVVGEVRALLVSQYMELLTENVLQQTHAQHIPHDF
jgi:hypothetical protein